MALYGKSPSQDTWNATDIYLNLVVLYMVSAILKKIKAGLDLYSHNQRVSDMRERESDPRSESCIQILATVFALSLIHHDFLTVMFVTEFSITINRAPSHWINTEYDLIPLLQLWLLVRCKISVKTNGPKKKKKKKNWAAGILISPEGPITPSLIFILTGLSVPHKTARKCTFLWQRAAVEMI